MAWASQQPTWAIGFADEVWWSRFALPHYGVLWQKGTAADPIRQDMSLRFVSGRPVSDITTQFLAWCCARLEKQGKTAWLLIWDNASWHNSKKVRSWIRQHNQEVKKEKKGVRILPFYLPTQSPWLNPIEPKWVHGKRNVVEVNGLLTANQLIERVSAYYRSPLEPSHQFSRLVTSSLPVLTSISHSRTGQVVSILKLSPGCQREREGQLIQRQGLQNCKLPHHLCIRSAPDGHLNAVLASFRLTD